MDSENHGKPYEQMDDLGVPVFLEAPIWRRKTSPQKNVCKILAARVTQTFSIGTSIHKLPQLLNEKNARSYGLVVQKSGRVITS